MQGSIHKMPNGAYQYRFSITDGQGKRRQITKSGFPTKTACGKAMRAAMTLHDKGFVIPTRAQGDITISEWFDEWLGERGDLKPSTKAWYGQLVRSYINPQIGGRKIREITKAHISELQVNLADHGGKNGRPLSERTVQAVSLLLKGGFWAASEDGGGPLLRSPMAHTKVHRIDPGLPHAWTEQEAQMFLIATRPERLSALFGFLLFSGTRRGECLGLRWSDVDLEHNTISLARSRIVVEGKVVEGTLKGAKGRHHGRLLDYDAAAMAELIRWSRQRKAELLALPGLTWDPNGYVFTEQDGRPLNPTKVSTIWRRTVIRTEGVPYLRLHDTRHTWASIALRNGVHPKIVSERLGHSSIVTTLDTYSHLIPAMQSEASALVTARMMGHHLGA